MPGLTEHEENPAAAMWGKGGRGYDIVSFAISDALAHGAQRLAPKPGENVLDIATGTGWTARNCARFGAKVTALDFSFELLEAARELSAGMEPSIDFVEGNAEALPFADACFDRVISTFGAMFAPDQQATADQVARVTKPGGRFVMVNWVPGGSVAEFFGVIGKYSDAPPPGPSPMDWGVTEKVEALLGGAFDLTFETGVSNAYHDHEEAIRTWYMQGFGPVRAVAENLAPDRLAAFERDLDAFHAHYRTASGMLHVKRDYLVVIGYRKG